MTMEDKDLLALKEEMAALATSVADISGCLGNFDTTLNNHMNDYKAAQGLIAAEQVKIRDLVTAMGLAVAKIQGSEGLAIILIKYVVLPLIVVLAGLIGVKLLLPGGVL